MKLGVTRRTKRVVTQSIRKSSLNRCSNAILALSGEVKLYMNDPELIR